MSTEQDVMFEAASEGGVFWENGDYVATLQKLEPGQVGKFGPTIKWTFFMAPDLNEPDSVVVQEDGETPAELWQFTSTKMTPQSTARPWVEAFMGRPLEEGEQVRPGELVGKRIIASIINEPSKTDGKLRAKIKVARPYNPDKIKSRPAIRTRAQSAAVKTEEEELDNGLPF